MTGGVTPWGRSGTCPTARAPALHRGGRTVPWPPRWSPSFATWTAYAGGRAALDDLVAALRLLRIDCGDLADFIRFFAQEGLHGPGSPGGLL